MSITRKTGTETEKLSADSSVVTMILKRVNLSMGGKGGVGKTSVMIALAEWFEANQIPVTLLDLDTENKARGSLTHFYMGAGSGRVTYEWFEKMYPDVSEAGIAFTAIGVVTPDPASVESVLAWAAQLQNKVRNLIVENATSTTPTSGTGGKANSRGSSATHSTPWSSRWTTGSQTSKTMRATMG